MTSYGFKKDVIRGAGSSFGMLGESIVIIVAVPVAILVWFIKAPGRQPLVGPSKGLDELRQEWSKQVKR